MSESEPGSASYEQIGVGYASARRTDPRIARRILHALGDAQSVLNVGAGTGSMSQPIAMWLRLSPRA